jgi:hypothetical protein
MSLEKGKWLETTPKESKKLSMSEAINIWLLSILLATSWVWNAMWEEVTSNKWWEINELQTGIEHLNQEAIDNHCWERWLKPEKALNCMKITWEKTKKLNEMSKLMNKQAMDILNTPIKINQQ